MLLVTALSACGGRTDLDDFVSGRDAGTFDAMTEDSAPADATSDAAVDAGCDLCRSLPSGDWSIVAFTAASTSAACPSGFTDGNDVLEKPTLGTACMCGSECTAVAQPDCVDLTVQTTFGAGCTVDGAPNSTGGGTCQSVADVFGGPACGLDPASVNVGCTGPNPVQNIAGIDAQHDQVCELGTLCTSLRCDVSIAPFQICIMAAGDQACPMSVPNKHSVGSVPSVVCGTCPCTATAECNGTLAFYSNAECTGSPELSVTTGACVTVPIRTPFGSYLWSAGPTPTPVCNVGGPSGATVTLEDRQTVCCP